MRGEYTCEEIAESYAYKLLTHCGPDKLNHYTEVCVLEALSDAAKWDLLIKKQPEIAGDLKGYPLLGVPISVKDSFNMKGYHTTWGGLARLCGKMGIAESDCALVAVLRNAGAVVLAPITDVQVRFFSNFVAIFTDFHEICSDFLRFS